MIAQGIQNRNGTRPRDRNRAVRDLVAEQREQIRMDLAALKCDQALTAGRLAMGDPPTYDDDDRAEQMGEAAIDEQNRMAKASAMRHHAQSLARRLVTARRAPRARARAPRRAAATATATSGAGVSATNGRNSSGEATISRRQRLAVSRHPASWQRRTTAAMNVRA